ncbi:MAG: bifunctional [glutamine synthetase] adenylyltransferase/[glutamine synthetase]-adenylyl-L-tyrosine phosphorylase [Beijerinckiaceae bacterium]|nr:bifunctional [glutamine synthetase] adenylyltransferase/[glutamine synthetase]-adenylyl-L-tyrosine phosphorylase [Beijerinckiaceae bacterium]
MNRTEKPAGKPLRQSLRSSPRVADKGRARWRLADLESRLDPSQHASLEARLVRALLGALADHSPFLWGLIEADPARLMAILDRDPAETIEDVLEAVPALAESSDEDEVMRGLRQARQIVALAVGLADLGGVWVVETVVQTLSRAADVFIAAALNFLLKQAERAGRLRLDAADPTRGCGLTVLALGKLGGRELNYSSDVDIVCLFDPEAPAIVDHANVQTLYARIVRDLVRLLQQATADGYVLRVDLRLRPEPSARSVAVSVPATLAYYETFGQNWERAALIKARPCAGDLALGAEVLATLAPFIWRKYLDLAAIADIHAMKRQIHAAKGGGEIAVAGHNVKLGRGGIRDIEFFVQTQQLIFGGKRPVLRGNRTVEMLHRLRQESCISRHAQEDLETAYAFLRGIEHRLQMIADQQTHNLPTSKEALKRFARFAGYESAAAFSATFERFCRLVAHHYALLFENAPKLGHGTGDLVFTGISDDPGTLRTLEKLGFRDPAAISTMVRAWHAGLRPAVRSPRARERLTELVPALLASFAKGSDPDAAVAGLDRALERLPTATELFAILIASGALRALFGEILGGAPRLAEAVAVHPHLLDIAIDGGAEPSLDDDAMDARVLAALARATTTEDVLDAARDYQHEEHFLIGTRLLAGTLAPRDAALAYSALAVGTIRALLVRAEATLAADHGRVPGLTLAVLGFGRLGSREMSATSDLDLVVVYDAPAQAMSDGARSLDASTWVTRLTQRLTTHLTAPTRRGRLYDVDMRLRPSGRQGPLATKFSAFAAYQKTTAATWEHLALTRARVVAGDAGLATRIEAAIAEALGGGSREGVMADVAEMRALMARERPPSGFWDLKLAEGGLVDGEFAAQALSLARPDLRDVAPRVVLERAAAEGLVPSGSVAAYDLQAAADQIIKLALPAGATPEEAGRGLKARLAQACGCASWPALKPALAEARATLRAAFEAAVLNEG